MITSISFVGMYLLYVVVVFLQEKYWYDEDANAQLVMVEMKKLASKSTKLAESKLHITSSTGASKDYDYDCRSMNEEFTATYYQNSPTKSSKDYSSGNSVGDTTSLIINEDYFS